MKLTNAEKILVVALLVYVVLDILLTPLAHLETRPVSGVTGLGLVTLALLFAGLAPAIRPPKRGMALARRNVQRRPGP